jgi:hypothetical protein
VKSDYPVGDVRALARLLAASVDETVDEATAQRLREEFTWEYRGKEIAALYQASVP